MIRSTILTAAFALLAGCGTPEAPNAADNAAAPGAEPVIEDVPSDGLAAPDGMPLDSESNSGGSTRSDNAV